jgi:hypothetical protein
MRSEHRRPRVDYAGAFGKESPADQAEMARTDAPNELSDRRMDPVGCNDECIRASRTIREDHVDLTVLLIQRCHSSAESQWDTGGAIKEYSVEVMPSDAHARTDLFPESCQLDFG